LVEYQKKAEERKIQKKKNDEVWIEFKESNKQIADDKAFQAFEDGKQENKQVVSEKFNHFDFGIVKPEIAEGVPLQSNRWAAPDLSNGNRPDTEKASNLFDNFDKQEEKQEKPNSLPKLEDHHDLLGIDIKVENKENQENQAQDSGLI
jgi:hypothetical protein